MQSLTWVLPAGQEKVGNCLFLKQELSAVPVFTGAGWGGVRKCVVPYILSFKDLPGKGEIPFSLGET